MAVSAKGESVVQAGVSEECFAAEQVGFTRGQLGGPASVSWASSSTRPSSSAGASISIPQVAPSAACGFSRSSPDLSSFFRTTVACRQAGYHEGARRGGGWRRKSTQQKAPCATARQVAKLSHGLTPHLLAQFLEHVGSPAVGPHLDRLECRFLLKHQSAPFVPRLGVTEEKKTKIGRN